MDGGNWISLAGVVIAAGSAIWSVLAARQSKTERESAAKEADRAMRAVKATEDQVAAAKNLVGESRRSADAAERLTDSYVTVANQAEVAPWEIIPAEDRSQYCYLRNKTPRTKYWITVRGPAIWSPTEGKKRWPVETIHGEDKCKFQVKYFMAKRVTPRAGKTKPMSPGGPSMRGAAPRTCSATNLKLPGPMHEY